MATDPEEDGFVLIQHELYLKAKDTVEVIDELLNRVTAEKQKLADMVAQRQAKRLVFLAGRLKAKQLTWCTQCLVLTPEAEAKLILLEGTRRVSCGYEGGDYKFEDYSCLDRLCLKCSAKAKNQHGFVGEYSTALHNQTRHLAFAAEQTENGFRANKFGNWQELDKEKYQLPDLPDKLADQLSEEWNLAPKMELIGGEVVIQQKNSMAV